MENFIKENGRLNNEISILKEKNQLLNKEASQFQETQKKTINQEISSLKQELNQQKLKLKEANKNIEDLQGKYNNEIQKNKLLNNEISQMKEESEYYKNKSNKSEEDVKLINNLKKQIQKLQTDMKRIEMSKDEQIKYEKSEKESIKQKYETLKQKMENSNMDVLNINNECVNNTIHKEIKCNMCSKNILTENKYKCSECPDFNLCEKCYVNNEKKNIHKHKFIIKKEDEKISNNKETTRGDEFPSFLNDSNITEPNYLYGTKNDDYYNEITKKINFDNDELEIDIQNDSIIYNHAEDSKYEYQVDQKEYIKIFKQGTITKITIGIYIKNIGINQWSDDTKLCCDNQSDLRCPEIKIKPLKQNVSDYVSCVFEGLEQIGFGKYIVLLNFIVDELIYGGPIKITLICEEDKELTKVNEFRKEFGLTKKEHDDQKLKQILKKNNWNFEQAFDKLFD